MNILIASPSWEERSLGFLLDIEVLNIDKVITIEYIDSLFPVETQEVIEKIEKEIRLRNILIEHVELSNDLIEKWKVLSDFIALLEISPNDEIYLDITTMSRNVIWALLFFLHQKKVDINIGYYQPKTYSLEWISKEPDVPRLLFKHSGIYKMGKPTALLILTGFDPERTRQLVRYYEPQKVILGLQEGTQFFNHELNNIMNHKTACVGLIDIDNICDFKFSAYSEDNGFSIIDSQLEPLLEEYNVIVSSQGPKLSAIALYKCFLKHEEIALSYVPCKEYNNRYCEGIGLRFGTSLKAEY